MRIPQTARGSRHQRRLQEERIEREADARATLARKEVEAELEAARQDLARHLEHREVLRHLYFQYGSVARSIQPSGGSRCSVR